MTTVGQIASELISAREGLPFDGFPGAAQNIELAAAMVGELGVDAAAVPWVI